MKYLVVGLGNPGSEYENTRHNVGFKVMDQLATDLSTSWETGKHTLVAQGNYKGRKLILLKPQTYMNLSGKAVSYWMQQEKLLLEHVLIVTDDIALPLGTLRLKMKGSDGGHNGLKSIDASLATQGYPRLRFGVGNDFFPGKQVEYVLGTWKEGEIELMQNTILRSVEGIKRFVTIGAGEAMTTMNAGK